MAAEFKASWKKARAAVSTDEAECIRILAEIVSTKEGRKFIFALEARDARECIEILHHGLTAYDLQASEKQVFFSTLRRLSGKHARLPDAMVIKDGIRFPDSSQPLASGGFADVKQGQYKGCTVAVKTLRVALTDDFRKIRKQFCQEVILWNSLSHPNVLKLVGVQDGFGEHVFATVSEWMTHGNIMEYIRKYPTNRLKLLHGAAQGLKYLHDANLTHGDLKGANILMTNGEPPEACLADFGFTSMVLDPENPMSCSVLLEGGTTTFMAPELLAPSQYGLDKAVPTQEGDIYAFGLVILQVLTGQYPFSNIKPRELPYHVSHGVRPEKPGNAQDVGISDSLWGLIQRCWGGEITRRPRIQEVVKGVGSAAARWNIEMPPSASEQREDSYVEEESDELAHRGIFETYQSEDPPPVPSPDTPRPRNTPLNPSPNTPRPGNTPIKPIPRAAAGNSEENLDVVYSHLEQNSRSPPSAIPPPMHKGLRYYLKKIPSIFGRKKH